MRKLTTNEKMQVNKVCVSKGLNSIYGRYLVAMYRGANTVNSISNLLGLTKHTPGIMSEMANKGWVKSYGEGNSKTYSLTGAGEEMAKFINNSIEEVAA